MRYEVAIIQRSPETSFEDTVFIEFFTLREATVFTEMVIENSNMYTKVTITKKQKEEEANGVAV